MTDQENRSTTTGPKPPKRAQKAFWIILGVIFLAIVYQNAQQPASSPDLTPVGPADSDASARNTSPTAGNADGFSPTRSYPPAGFAGVRWNAVLPPKAALLKTTFRGCAKILDIPVASNAIDKLPCSHTHITTDNIDLFVQAKNVPDFYGVHISSQMLMWSNRKFYSGRVFVENYDESQLATLRNGLRRAFGLPTYSSDARQMDWWRWPDEKIQVLLTYDPVAKPSVDPTEPKSTSIEVSIGRVD
jgi:hypothetical protein